MTSAKALSFDKAVWDVEAADDSPQSKLILELYDREHISLRRYLIWLGLDSSTAEETVQETFLRLHQHLLSKGDRTNLKAWLYRVAHNFARNVQSSSRASKTTYLADLSPEWDPRVASDSAEQNLIVREKETRLRNAMAQLSAAQRNCVVLRSQGLKYREIAEALGLSISTVAENVARGLENLKEKL